MTNDKYIIVVEQGRDYKGHARAIRFSTLDRLCEVLDCQPGDLLSYRREKNSSGDKKL